MHGSKKLYVIQGYEICKYTITNLLGFDIWTYIFSKKNSFITSAKFGRIYQNLTEIVKFCAFLNICKHLFPIGNGTSGFVIYSSRMRSNFTG